MPFAGEGLGDLVEEADVTYAGGFPEDYSDVFGPTAPVAVVSEEM